MICVIELILLLFIYVINIAYCQINKFDRFKGKYYIYSSSYQNDLNFFWVSCALILILCVGLRSYSVGIDTSNYVHEYMQYLINPSERIREYDSTIELGFQIYMYVLAMLRIPYGGFLLLSAIVSILPVILLIKSESDAPWLSLIIYFGTTLYSWTYSSIRQSIAIGLCVIAYAYAKKRNFTIFLLVVLLASTFHQTAIIFLIIYLFNFISLKKRSILVILVCSVIAIAFKNGILSIMYNYARIVYNETEVGGNRYLFLLIFTAIIGCIFRQQIFKNSVNENSRISFYSILILPAIYSIVQVNPIMFRLTWYFQIFLIIYIPNLLVRGFKRSPIIRIIGYTGYSVAYIYFFLNQVLASTSKLSPYGLWIIG